MIHVTATWNGHDTTVTVDPADTHDTTSLALLLGAAKQIQHRIDEAKAEAVARSELRRIASKGRR